MIRPSVVVGLLRAPCAMAGAVLCTSLCGSAAWGTQPRHLLVEVRDSAPGHTAVNGRGADGSFTVSTGAAAEPAAPVDTGGNGATLATHSGVRQVHVIEGERIRVDLPAVQSLQFHVPLPAAKSAASGAAAAPAPSASATARSAGASAGASAPGASGVVYFEGVVAFTARFFLAGDAVRIELVPLRQGSVAAPFEAAASGPNGAIVARAPLGTWVPLGDSDLQLPGKSLNASAEPPSPAAVWVRVLREGTAAR